MVSNLYSTAPFLIAGKIPASMSWNASHSAALSVLKFHQNQPCVLLSKAAIWASM
jgi:hypothetical protein